MDLDNNFTALIIAIFIVTLLAGLFIYYNGPQFKNVQTGLHIKSLQKNVVVNQFIPSVNN